MPLRTNLKKGMLLITLVGLLCIGADLLEGLLPYEWRHTIDQRFDHIFHLPTYEPHPNIDWEFELDFREHPRDRVIQYAVLVALILGDGYLISRVWRALRKASLANGLKGRVAQP